MEAKALAKKVIEDDEEEKVLDAAIEIVDLEKHISPSTTSLLREE